MAVINIIGSLTELLHNTLIVKHANHNIMDISVTVLYQFISFSDSLV